MRPPLRQAFPWLQYFFLLFIPNFRFVQGFLAMLDFPFLPFLR
jgi:hypothetical protein